MRTIALRYLTSMDKINLEEFFDCPNIHNSAVIYTISQRSNTSNTDFGSRLKNYRLWVQHEGKYDIYRATSGGEIF